MSFLRGSTNYVWCTTSVLGKGATGAVFQVTIDINFNKYKLRKNRLIALTELNKEKLYIVGCK